MVPAVVHGDFWLSKMIASVLGGNSSETDNPGYEISYFCVSFVWRFVQTTYYYFNKIFYILGKSIGKFEILVTILCLEKWLSYLSIVF